MRLLMIAVQTPWESALKVDSGVKIPCCIVPSVKPVSELYSMLNLKRIEVLQKCSLFLDYLMCYEYHVYTHFQCVYGI